MNTEIKSVDQLRAEAEAAAAALRDAEEVAKRAKWEAENALREAAAQERKSASARSTFTARRSART